jgi:hypothetical protein
VAMTLGALVEKIIRELTRLQTTPAPWRGPDDDFGLPRMIDAGNGGSLIVSRTIDEGIAEVADKLFADDAKLGTRYTRAEWRAAARRAFGPALARIDLDDSPATSAEQVLADIREALDKHVSGDGPREYAFGCTLFGNTAVMPFRIGPVRFEPRLDWIARMHAEGAVSAISRRRIENAWSGRRLRKRKPSLDRISEVGILDAVGDCAFVCSVATHGLGPEAGRGKALTAARLATAAIGLMWQTPSKALEGLNLLFDRTPHNQRALTFVPGTVVLAGSSWSHMPHGPWLKTGQWEQVFSERADHFSVVGDVLAYVLSPTGAVARRRMMNTLAQALLWFHEGCRETVTLMAIVKFSAALDALACGGKAGGIQRLMSARLGIPESRAIRPDGPTLKQAIEEIYSDGRSRTIHGTNVKMGHDWTRTKSMAEQFTRLCLLLCINWAANNPSSDDPSQLAR